MEFLDNIEFLDRIELLDQIGIFGLNWIFGSYCIIWIKLEFLDQKERLDQIVLGTKTRIRFDSKGIKKISVAIIRICNMNIST